MEKVFIVNKASRTGKAEGVWNKIEEYLKSEGVDYEVHFTAKAYDATEFAKKATSSGEEVHIFVMGGDGTLNEALNAPVKRLVLSVILSLLIIQYGFSLSEARSQTPSNRRYFVPSSFK